jgi:type III restriction enzyme
MAFTDKPIITNPFDTPQFHYELDDEGQPTGKKPYVRHEIIHNVPVPTGKLISQDFPMNNGRALSL